MTADDPRIEHLDGWWWPTADRRGRPVILRDCGPAIAALLKHVPGRTCIVQAGGNVGVYALALTDHFRRVITFEPDPANVACLWRNIAARDALRRVDARMAALGEDVGQCSIVEVEPDNCGAHRIKPGKGKVVVYPLDGLELIACDAIWLDIEGFELAALKGARETLQRFKPVVCIEDKGLSEAYGVPVGEAARWLQALGYEQVDRIGNDYVFRSTK